MPESPEGSKQPTRPVVTNVLAERYASTPMLEVFSPIGKVIAGRELWIEVMKGQKAAGLSIPEDAIKDYERVKGSVDMESLRRRELISHHDENARIEEFNALAGHQYIHLGFTSRDVSDNVEQMQIRKGLLLVRERAVATLARLGRNALLYEGLVYADRTHNAIAQPSVVGKIHSNVGEELLMGFNVLEGLIDSYPIRGIKGATGTQTDQLKLFNGDQAKVDELEETVARSLGFKNILGSVGQTYPRSLDAQVTHTLFQLSAGPSSYAETMRLMAGRDQFTEGFSEGQVGSNAMPHKMNAPLAERLVGLQDILAGHVTMADRVAGRQWYSGDVSNSSTRRVFIPDSFFAVDGILQTTLHILDRGGFYPAVIGQEVEKYLPFLTTTRMLMTAVGAGMGRETAHELIKKHAVAVALEMREQGTSENNLLQRLEADPEFEVPSSKLKEALANPSEFTGSASKQVTQFVDKVQKVVDKYPKEATYNPDPIL